jgi:subtilisin family serine protease
MRSRFKLAGAVVTVACAVALFASSMKTVSYLAVAEASQAEAWTSNEDEPSSFAVLADGALWRHLERSGRSAVVGLKRSGQSRGMRDGLVLLDKTSWAQARTAVSEVPGVTLVEADDLRPNVTIVLEDQEAMSTVRNLPQVEFLEPASVRIQSLAPGLGCTGNSYNWSPTGGDPYQGTPATFGNDSMPNNFLPSRIPDAWRRGATGVGVTVGVVDTGVFSTQEQLQQHQQFATGFSTDRSITHLNALYAPNSGWDECNHGTRVVSLIAAPRDGVNMLGVAWRANVVSVKHGNDVTVDSAESTEVARAIRLAAGLQDNFTVRSRVVQMAFGTGPWNYDNIRQEIAYWHNRGVLFVGAAGSQPCPGGVTYPAKLPQVMAVTGVQANGTLHPDVCGGPEVELAVRIDDMFSSGRRNTDLITMGGSSGASSVVSGVAALVLSEHPGLSRDQLRNRLVAAGNRCCGSGVGAGLVNAYQAVGGFVGVSISGPNTVDPYQSYTLTAQPRGDGPFTYRWSNGATTRSITVTAGAAGTVQRFSVTATDTRENKSLTASTSVTVRDPYVPPDDCSPYQYCP